MFSNSWVVKADIKFKYSASIPIFRRKDTAVINFLIHDNKKLYDISTFTGGEVTITFPQGHYIVRPCTKVNIDGLDYIQYIVNKEELVEIGRYKFHLSFNDATGRVSIQDILVDIFDSLGTAELAYIKLIQDLQNQITYLDSIIDNIVLKERKGKANGLVELDADGKIKELHMPDYLRKHIDTNVYLNWVHGLYIDKDGVAKYKTKDGGEENVGHEDTGSKVNVSVKIANGIATLTFTGNGSVVAKRYKDGDRTLLYVKQNGTILNGNSFPVDKTGIWSVYYKDNKDVEYIFKFNVSVDNLKEPTTTVDADNGEVTVVTDTGVEISKYAKGKQELSYFRTNGTTFTGKFSVAEVGDYTVYIKYKDGRERVYYLTVTEDDLEKVDDTPPVITMVLAPSNGTVTSANKILTVSIVDTNTISDKRYYFKSDSDSTVVNIQKFRDSANFGTKMTSDTQKITVQENGMMHVYARDSFGNDTMNTFYVSSIDRIGANRIEYDDVWDDVKNKYIVRVTIYASNVGNNIVNAQPSIVVENIKKEFGTGFVYLEYEVSSVTDHQITATVQSNLSSVFDVKMKGKVKSVSTAWSSTIFILYESGDVYVNGRNNEYGIMALPKDSVVDSSKWYKMPFPEKVKRLHVNAQGGLAHTTNGNIYVWGHAFYVGFEFKYPYGTYLYTPELYTDAMGAKEIIPNRGNFKFKGSDGRWYGVGYTASFGNGNEYTANKPVVLASNRTYTNVFGEDAYSFFIGTDNKLYASGSNNESQLGIPFVLPWLIRDARESTMLNPLGVVDSVFCGHDSASNFFHFKDGSMKGIGGVAEWGTGENQKVQNVTGMPTDEKPIMHNFERGLYSFLTDKGNVYVTGDNRRGELPVGNTGNIPLKQLVKVDTTEKIIDIKMNSITINFNNISNGLTMVADNGKVYGVKESEGMMIEITNDIMFKISGAKK